MRTLADLFPGRELGRAIRVIAIVALLGYGYESNRHCAGGSSFLAFLLGPSAIAMTFGIDAWAGREQYPLRSGIALTLVAAVGLFVLSVLVGLAGSAAGTCGNF